MPSIYSHILGAGAGGIATAARLSKAGYKVTVVEKNSFVGGRCSLVRHEDYVRSSRFSLRTDYIEY